MSRAHAKKPPVDKVPAIVAAENAPLDDEPLTEEDLRAIEEGLRDHREGRCVSTAQLVEELGLRR
jgi:hypothetical protein